MADSPSDEWGEREGGVRRLQKRAKHTDHSGDAREQEAVTDYDRPPLAGGEKYAPNVPNGHRLTKDPEAKEAKKAKAKTKAVDSSYAQNKAVSSEVTK